jgi:hypothetical protein
MRKPLSSTFRQALLVLPVAGGAVLGKLSDSTPASAALLLVEPLFWLAAVHILLFLLFSRRERMALAFLLSSSTGLILLHIPLGSYNSPVGTQVIESSTLTPLVDCTGQQDISPVPIRVLQWTIDAEHEIPLSALEISRMQPDLVLFSGLPRTDLADELATLLGGEAVHTQGNPGQPNTSLVIRGHFLECGSESESWSMASNSDDSSMVMYMADLVEAGPTPILAVQIGSPGSLGDLAPWHQRLTRAQVGIAQIKRTLGFEKLVTLGDFGAPRSFQGLSSTLESVGLSEAELPASWPSGLGIAPLPGLHAFDRLWYGGAWMHQDSRKVRVLSQSRAMILTDLMPYELGP